MKRVMIVDDSLFQRKSLRKLIEALRGIVVAEATNGSEAIELYPLFRPDLVLMDIMMPEMEGTEAIRAIIETDPDAAIIVISSLAHREIIDEALSLGARQYISKPLDLEAAVSALKPFLVEA